MSELIVITQPQMLLGEAAIINQLFANGLVRLHVRKPEATEADLRKLLAEIAPEFRGRIALHQHHQLAEPLGISGLHFTEQNRLSQGEEKLGAFQNGGFTLSTSIHNATDLESLSHCIDYVFFGPVFDSISKQGYASKLPATFKLEKYGFPGKVIALGGIDAKNVQSALDMGFEGIAILGSIWQNPANAIDQFQQFQSRNSEEKAIHCPGFQPGDRKLMGEDAAIDRFHFISNETATMSHLESIRLALEAGCRWIQLRVKERPEVEVLPIAWEATRLCDSYGAKLVINDFPRVALAVGAYGLHLGLTDMPVREARALVGDEMVIGGTANTWEDIALRIDEGADYIGLGPFRFTSTKQNLSPILGAEGYAVLMQQMAKKGFNTPVIAIGGIIPNDIRGLRKAGIYGVALSAALTGSADPRNTFNQIQQALC